jgi:hypothetical protein
MLPSDFFEKDLSHPEFKLVVSLYHLSGPKRLVDATMAELSVLTHMGEESLRRALRGLEKHGLVATTRTKRNYGKLYTNTYKLLIQPLENEGYPQSVPLENEGSSQDLPLENEGSTYGHVISVGTSKLTIDSYPSKPVNSSKGTTYLLVDAVGVHPKTKESSMWKDTSGDDDIAGFGLFEEEMSQGQPKPKADKRKSSTRSQRPQSEWTANDIAAEFSERLAKLFPYTPGLVNVSAIRGALLKNRKQYGITPDIEMEIIRMFFADARNTKNADENARNIHAKFLHMFKTHLKDAYASLGIAMPKNEAVTQSTEVDYLVASDGQRFDNSAIGRRLLKQHEQDLKESL